MWLVSYWVESDWMTRPTRCRILYQDESSSIMTNWSCHHPFISCHQLCHWLTCPVYNSPLDWSNPVSRLFVRWVSRSLSYDSPLLCFIILSPTLCHMPLSLLIIRLISFPWQHFPFVLDDSFILMIHFISLMILPIVHTLLDAFVPYCCSIYGLHICGVLSWPHFLYLSCIR